MQIVQEVKLMYEHVVFHVACLEYFWSIALGLISWKPSKSTTKIGVRLKNLPLWYMIKWVTYSHLLM